MVKKEREEYWFLTEKLEEIECAIDGKCDDIDCDKFVYKNFLKKKYKPVLEHEFSCMEKLKIEKLAVLRILSQKKYRNYRYIKCKLCKKNVDTLDEKSKIVSFTRPSLNNDKYFEWKGVWAHKKCASKIKIPIGWKKFL